MRAWAFYYETREEANAVYHRKSPEEQRKKSNLSMLNMLINGDMPAIYILAPDAWRPEGFGGIPMDPDPDVVAALVKRRDFKELQVLLGELPATSDVHYDGGKRLDPDGFAEGDE